MQQPALLAVGYAWKGHKSGAWSVIPFTALNVGNWLGQKNGLVEVITEGQHWKCNLDWSLPHTRQNRLNHCAPEQWNAASLLLSLFLTCTHTRNTPCIPLYPRCMPPKHHKITASYRKFRNPLLLFFTLIKVSNSLPNSRGSARQSYGNFGSANSRSQKDRHCFCCVGVFAIMISIYADPELMCRSVMYH